MIDLEQTEKYLPYIAIIISKMVKNTVLQLFLIGCILTFSALITYRFSKYSQQKHFRNYVQNEMEANTSIEFRNIMQNEIIHFTGKDINVSLFWEHLLAVDLSIAEKYKEDVKIIHVTVNDEPSWAFQLNGDPKNDNKLKQISSLITKAERDKRFAIINKRKKLFDINDRIKHFSVYCKDGINQATFENNVKNSNGKINNKRMQDCSFISKHLRGIFTIIKHKNGSILLFIEYNGEQTFGQSSDNNKQLVYRYFNNKNNIFLFDKKLHELLIQTGILDTL